MHAFFPSKINFIKMCRIIIHALAFLFFIGECFGSNPFKTFYKKNNIGQKSILVTLNLNDCSTCHITPDFLLKKIRLINGNIPVYFLTQDSLTNFEKKTFKVKLGGDTGGVFFVTDRKTYDYMLHSKNGIPSVCCLSSTGKPIVFNHLKHENLNILFETIKIDFELKLINKILLKNKYVSPTKCRTMIQINHDFFAFHPGVNLLSMYDKNGSNIKNIWLDSLEIDYLQVTRKLFNTQQQRNSERHYYTARPARNQLISPVNIMEFGKDTLCVTATILCVGDTVYSDELLLSQNLQKLSGKSVKYHQRHACLLLFDTSLNYLGLTHFYPYSEGAAVSVYCNGAAVGSRLYFGRYDEKMRQVVMGEYLRENTGLILNRQFKMPQNLEEMIPFSINKASRESLTVTYPKLEKGKLKIVSTNLYKFSAASGVFSKELDANMFLCPKIDGTPKGNYILLVEIDNTFMVKGFDLTSKKIVNPTDKKFSYNNYFRQNSSFFFLDGYLMEYAYRE